jgi:hypothetical protein
MLAVEVCSGCYFVDNTLETVLGNAICADGAAAFLLAGGRKRNANTHRLSTSRLSSIRSRSRRLDFNIAMASCESYWAPRFNFWLRPPMIETALQPLPQWHGSPGLIFGSGLFIRVGAR